MKTLHQYLARQVLASLALTVVVFTFVLLVGNLLKEILSLVVGGHARLGLMLKAIALLVPFLWVYALPMGLLTATLLVFGRFSADQELTAARASGISLISLITPILLISLVCCGLSFWINLELGPQSRVAYLNLIYQARYEMAGVQMPEGTYIRDFPGYLCYVDKNRDGNLAGVKITKFDPDTNHPNPIVINAPGGRLEVDWPHRQLQLYLTNVVSSQTAGLHERTWFARAQTYPIDLTTATNQVYHPRISDMTYEQLQTELRELQFPDQPGQKNMSLPVRVEINRRFSFSFASFAFVLVGIPLGIRMHRRETNLGVAAALGLAVIYYGFILLATSLSTRPEFHPQLILWLPNFIFQAVGALLLWRANRGF